MASPMLLVDDSHLDIPELDEKIRGNLRALQNARARLDDVIAQHQVDVNGDIQIRANASGSEDLGKDNRKSQARRRVHKDAQFWTEMRRHEASPDSDRVVDQEISEKAIRKSIKRNEELGPIAEQYRLVINTNPDKHIMLLQYPDRIDGQLYCGAYGQKPLEIRIKPKSGLVEVDIPLSIDRNYNKKRGRTYASALHTSSRQHQAGSLHTVPGPSFAKRRAGDADVDMMDAVSDVGRPSDAIDESLSDGSDVDEPPNSRQRVKVRNIPNANGSLATGNYSDSEEHSVEENLSVDTLDESDGPGDERSLMRNFTLEGRIDPLQEGDPIYMIATFQNDVCTWTKVDAVVSLRAQFSYLDALRTNSKVASHSKTVDENLYSEQKRKTESKAEDVNKRIKDPEEPESSDLYYGGISETISLLRQMANEPWQSLAWVDQDDPLASAVLINSLTSHELKTTPKLVSVMTKVQYLDAISCPRVDPIRRGEKIMKASESEAEDDPREERTATDSAIEIDEGDWFAAESDPVNEEPHKSHSSGDKEGTHIRPNGLKVIWKQGIEYSTRPKGRPTTRKIEVLIEQVCRMICAESVDRQGHYTSWLRERKGNEADYAFLNPKNHSHHYFRWRLAENRAGRGIQPIYDAPSGPPEKKSSRQTRRGGPRSSRGRMMG